MKVTVDANVLFACLIRDSQTRRLWFNPEIKLFAPEFIFREFLKYKKVVEKKSQLKQEKFNRLLEIVISQIDLVPGSELKPYLPAAVFLIKDPDDWLYLACALKGDTIIWSNDKGFKKQNRVKVRTTKELIKRVGLL